MDKRWIYILIILIIGVISANLIIGSSNTVGTANTNLDKFTVSLPHSFNIEDQSGKHLILIDRNTNEKISIFDLGKKNSAETNMSLKIDALENNENVTFIKKSPVKINNETLPSIYYEKIDYVNRITYVTKYNHLFSVDCIDFNDNQTIYNNTKYIIDSITPDYKQKQD